VDLIAQLTDLHALAPGTGQPYAPDHNARIRMAVAALEREDPAPSVVLGTGDLCNNPTAADLAALLGALEGLTLPLLPLPGNHDDRRAVKAAFPLVPWADAEHASWSVPHGAVHLVGLDSTRPGQPGGEFDHDREAWLAQALAAATAPVLLALHHPPFATGIRWMDVPFLGLERLVEVIASHNSSAGGNRVTKVVAGHMHRPISGTVAGVPVQTGVSTVNHVALDLRPGARPSLIADPVGYQLHLWEGSDWVTHTRYLDTGSESFVPPWADDWEAVMGNAQ
jgi:Icc protein